MAKLCSCCTIRFNDREPQPETTPGPSLPPHHSVQEVTGEPSTMTNLKHFLVELYDISQLFDLIMFIEELLKITLGEKSDVGQTSGVASCILSGQEILKMIAKNIGELRESRDFMGTISFETHKFLLRFLESATKVHWVGVALSTLGYVLKNFSHTSSNKMECLEILRRSFDLGKEIIQLNDIMPEQKQKLNEAVECIVVGCIMCVSQIAMQKEFRFISSSVNADSLQIFRIKIDCMWTDLTLWGLIDTAERVPKIASQSQDFFVYRPTVGIARALKTVVRLLDLNAQDTIPQVVVIYGFGGVGKTTLADAVYANIDLQHYKYSRIHMDQDCTKNDLKLLQERILYELFGLHVKLRNCDHGRGMIRSLSVKNPNQPLFLYIDNGLRSKDLEELLPQELGSWLPPRSRLLVTTRNLQETDIFVARNIQRRQYAVHPLPPIEARKLLLENVSEYNDEMNIDMLLKLCGGVPVLLEIAGSQLAINRGNRKNIVLEMLKEGEKVEERDLSDRMVGFVYHRLLPPVQEAFLDITSFFYNWQTKQVMCIVGEEEYRALEAASLISTSENGNVIVNNIIRARGRKMSEENRFTDTETLLEYMEDREKLKNLKGLCLNEEYEQPPIQINNYHLKCMSSSLRVLSFEGCQISFREKCQEPFKNLRYLNVPSNGFNLPLEFEKLERLAYYRGPLMQGMSLYQLPPSLHYMFITGSSGNGDEYSKIPPKIVSDSSLVELSFSSMNSMETLPDGVETLTKLEELRVMECQLRELPSKFGELHNLKVLSILDCPQLKELPSNFGQLQNLEELNLTGCSRLEAWPSSFGDLLKIKKINLAGCSSKLKETLPHNIGAIVL